MDNVDVASIFGSAFLIIVYIAIIALMIISLLKVFTKAGKPGWAAIVPIYNYIVMLEIARQPLWMIVLFFIPIGNLIALIIIDIEIANNFGKSGGFAAGLILLPIVFFPILAFGDAKYQNAT